MKRWRLVRATALGAAVVLSGCSTYATARSPGGAGSTQAGSASVMFVPRAQDSAPGERAPAYHLPVAIGVHAITIGTLRGDVDVFVATYGPGDPIYVFHHDRRKPFETISNSLLGINGVAFQPAAR